MEGLAHGSPLRFLFCRSRQVDAGGVQTTGLVVEAELCGARHRSASSVSRMNRPASGWPMGTLEEKPADRRVVNYPPGNSGAAEAGATPCLFESASLSDKTNKRVETA
ncbi:hypothetical protein CSC28_1551 [Pseudomonas paraeruginosa]|nr:hypothetical protein CSC28_1551 [Pseudomonas paraeruginosa]